MDHWIVVRTHIMYMTWDEAQRLANFNRRRGHRVHVCSLSKNRHALWPTE